MTFQEFYQQQQSPFEEFLLNTIHSNGTANQTLHEAMRYSVEAGGKRLRPLLLLMVLKAFGKEVQTGYPAGAAVELIHTYSLIHDDLPAMDDDAMRRGRPSSHIVFGEATAILAGDALLTLAFSVIAVDKKTNAEKVLKLIAFLSESAGPKGMVAGQQEDIDGENRTLSLSEIQSIHRKKTGALLSYSFYAGGLLSDCSDDEMALLNGIAEKIGLAYQIRDDILDITSTQEELGKPVGSDEEKEKSTYPHLLGLAGSYERLDDELDAALQNVVRLKEVTTASGKDFENDLFISFIESMRLEETNK